MTYADKAASWAESVAADNSVGYEWGGWGPKGYDCGHLVIAAYEQAGIKVKNAGASYTGNIPAVFIHCGFSVVTGKVDLSTGAGLRRGDVLVNLEKHAAMALGNGKIVQARSNFDGKPGDSSGQEIRVQAYYNYPWDYVLRPPGSTVAEATKQAVHYQNYIYRVPLNLLKQGDYGPLVKTVQLLLKKKGFSCNTDGKFSASTAAAVKAFQKKQKLDVDGEVGGQTYAKLFKS